MITHYAYPGAFGLPSLSPFCLKIEAYLALAELPFKTKPGNPQKAPHGKLPYIKDETGTLVADSSQIIDHIERRRGNPLDGWLTAEQKALGHLVKRTVEESLYFCILYQRWKQDEGWAIYRPLIGQMMPAPLGYVLPPVLRRNVVKALHGQGMGRFTPEQAWERGGQDIDAVAHILGSKPYLLGDRPSSADCAAWGQLALIARSPVEGPLKQRVLDHPALVAWIERIWQAVEQTSKAASA